MITSRNVELRGMLMARDQFVALACGVLVRRCVAHGPPLATLPPHLLVSIGRSFVVPYPIIGGRMGAGAMVCVTTGDAAESSCVCAGLSPTMGVCQLPFTYNSPDGPTAISGWLNSLAYVVNGYRLPFIIRNDEPSSQIVPLGDIPGPLPGSVSITIARCVANRSWVVGLDPSHNSLYVWKLSPEGQPEASGCVILTLGLDQSHSNKVHVMEFAGRGLLSLAISATPRPTSQKGTGKSTPHSDSSAVHILRIDLASSYVTGKVKRSPDEAYPVPYDIADSANGVVRNSTGDQIVVATCGLYNTRTGERNDFTGKIVWFIDETHIGVEYSKSQTMQVFSVTDLSRPLIVHRPVRVMNQPQGGLFLSRIGSRISVIAALTGLHFLLLVYIHFEWGEKKSQNIHMLIVTIYIVWLGHSLIIESHMMVQAWPAMQRTPLGTLRSRPQIPRKTQRILQHMQPDRWRMLLGQISPTVATLE
ncbi:hypothetical protein Pelo_14791 [Pelomyxa schiedti]|nr:hypothetical protein Pelo_14791 [Pelomyxa schiedti]